MKAFHVYIMASQPRGTVYTGLTSNLVQRAWQQREGEIPGFTTRYGVKRLVWFEAHDTAEAAIRREKRLKEWPRAWKLALVEASNPDWVDRYSGLVAG